MKITAAMIRRYESGRLTYSDPCIICGGNTATCGHDMDDTAPVCQKIKRMSRKQRDDILNAPESE